MFETALLLTAAFVAGALNAVAGGGSFLTLPALVFVGVPPVVANATGTVALLPGYAAGAWGFREDTQAPPGLSMRLLVVLSLIGPTDRSWTQAPTYCRQKKTPVITSPVATMPQRSHSAGMRLATRAPM